MNYETKLNQKDNIIKLENRNKLEITGVKKIESLNSEEFVVNTSLGIITILGEKLEMVHLDIDKGILWISGQIDCISYNKDAKPKEKKQSFLGKVFK